MPSQAPEYRPALRLAQHRIPLLNLLYPAGNCAVHPVEAAMPEVVFDQEQIHDLAPGVEVECGHAGKHSRARAIAQEQLARQFVYGLAEFAALADAVFASPAQPVERVLVDVEEVHLREYAVIAIIVHFGGGEALEALVQMLAAPI